MARKRRESFEMALARVIALDELPEKKCGKCGEVKSPAEFSASLHTRSGLCSRCRACDAEVQKAQRENRKAHNTNNDPHADPTPKRCPGCGRTRPRADYGLNRSAPDGLHYICRECNAQRCREQQENRKIRNAANNPYSDPTPKRCSDCGQMLPRTDYPQNKTRPDGLHPQCRECAARRAREWGLNNPDKRREITRAANHRRRARKLQNGVVPYREEDVYAASDYLCVYCGAPAEEIDHFIPISRGGADAPWNVVATCVACNRGPGGKFVRDPIEFLISRGIHIDRVVIEHACGEVEEIPLRDACADER